VVPAFIPGLRLAREFCTAVVRPLLAEQFPQVSYAAALLGPGAEVAGFDTQRSTDHDWGPRLQVFLGDGAAEHAAPITAMLASRLPASFRGYPVAFPVTREPGGIARHRVEVAGLGDWLTGHLGFDPRHAVTLLDWLATPAQRLAEFTTGEVFHDGPGELTRAREALAWYPRDVWLYLLACQWQRIEQEEPFPGRCAEAGDDLGSVVVTARLARDLVRLWLLMHRRYPPYSKWLGTAFARLPGTASARLAASLAAAVTAGDWRTRERHLTRAYETAAALHNTLELTPPLDTRTRRFHDRPYQVIGAARFTAALRAAITDPRISRLPHTGAIDQFTDSTDAIADLRFTRACAEAAIQRDFDTSLQVQERTQDAPDGGQLTGGDRAKTALETLVCHRARIFGPGEGGELAQAGRLRGDRNLMTQSAVPARDRYHEHDRMRQRQVQRAGNDDDRPAAGLFRSDDGIQVSEPDIAGPQRLAHSSPIPSPAV
jgi:hypothetical protein